MLTIGDYAPDIILKDTDDFLFDFKKELKGKLCIIYFYPKDFTPGCTIEACSFRDHFDYFTDLDISIIGISKDSVASHARFKARHDLPFTLLADPDGKVCKQYDALVPLLNIPKRISYLLDKDHKIVEVYQNFFGAHQHIKKMIKLIR